MAQAERERSLWWTAALVALATVFMLQSSRVFVGYLIFVVDQSQRVTLITTALAVFLAPGLAWALVRAVGTQRLLLASTAILVLARLTLQFWQEPAPRIVLGAIVIAAWGWLTIVALHRFRDGAAFGIVLALAIDVAVRIGAGSIDLPWMPGLGAHLVTVLLALLLVLAAFHVGSRDNLSSGPALPLVALGPALVLHHLVTGNLALAQVTTSLSFPAAWSALAAGLLLGLLGVVFAASRPAHMLSSLFTVFAGGISLLLFWATSTLPALWLVIATASITVLTSRALMTGQCTTQVSGIGRAAVAVTGGMVLQVLLLFVYYTFTGWWAMVAVAWAMLAAATLMVRPPHRLTTRPVPRSIAAPVVMVSLALLLVCAWQFVVWTEPETSAASSREITVMTYNIQSGFAVDNVWSLEETARAIETEDPDVLVLNEVGRGWLVTSGNDAIPWLSRRLGMQYVWGPASDDDLWGNAILSKLPIAEGSVEKFASTQNLKRSATGVWVRVGERGVWVFGTHLDNPAGADEVRMEQVSELISFWDERQPAIVLGDLNVDADDVVLTTFADLGFLDPGVQLGEEAFTSEDRRRIDYILTSDGIEVIDIWIPDTWKSDHKPVVARVRLGQ